MDAEVVGELRVERGDGDRALAAQHRVAVDGGEHLDVGARPARRTGARMNTAWNGPSGSPSTSRSASNESTWRPKALRRTRDVDGAEAALVGPAVEHLGAEQDHPGAGAERGHARRPGARRAGRTGRTTRAASTSWSTRRRAGPARRPRRAASGVRTSDGAQRRGRASASAWRAKAPCRARTPTFTWGPPHVAHVGTTSRGRRAWSRGRRSRGRASPRRGRGRPWRRCRRRRSGWWPRRWPWPGGPGRRT